MTVTPEAVAALIARADEAVPDKYGFSNRAYKPPSSSTLLALARSWQAQQTELDRLRTIIAALVELDSEPDLVIAFPGGRGTADMIRRAHAAGIPVQTGGAT